MQENLAETFLTADQLGGFVFLTFVFMIRLFFYDFLKFVIAPVLFLLSSDQLHNAQISSFVADCCGTG